ncbi:MAG: GTP-binding protein [Bacilli bacterium]|nr:GTP-binding protein [Bacilli bacterium]
MKKNIPITLLTGYLGSGKTTLINHILKNNKNKKIAIIVNDIGEVNIDADLIGKDGIVSKKDESLVALSNGCICCNLQMDLVEQILEIVKQDKFDYIIIEASGICEPIPIAQTITMINNMYNDNICYIDSIVTITDALRLANEFNCGKSLINDNIDDEDLEKLIIEQLEFCDVIILNKVSDLSSEDLKIVKTIIKQIQPSAKLIEADYAKIDIDEIIDNKLFDFETVSMSAGWIKALDNPEEHDESEEALEYGIETFVYYRRSPFNRKMFYKFINSTWDKSIIRTKGVVYFTDELNMAYMFETAGNSKNLVPTGPWVSDLSKEEQQAIIIANPDIKDDWDPEFGDKMIKIVVIGKNINKEKLIDTLDSFLDL